MIIWCKYIALAFRIGRSLFLASISLRHGDGEKDWRWLVMDGGNNLSFDWLLIGLWIINCLRETGYEDEDWLVCWCAPGPGVYRGAWARVFQLSCFQLRVERQAFRPRNVSYLTILSFFCHSYLLLFDCYDINLGFLETSASCLLIGTLFCSYVVDEMIVVCILFSGFACTEITMVS